MINRYASLRQGLVGCWIPSLAASGYRLIDRSGNNNHGTLTGMDPGTDWVPSGGKLALDFDGVNDYSVFDDNQSLDITSAITLACWVYSRSNSIYQAIVTKRNGPNGSGTQYGISKTNLNKIGFMYGGGYRELSSTSDIPINAWVHIAVSYVSSSLSCMFYLNGVVDRTATGSIALSTQTGGVNIGRNNDASYPEYFNGQIDDVRVYNRALTPSEIRLLYTGGRGIGLLPERIKHRRKTTAAATNRRRRIICGANC